MRISKNQVYDCKSWGHCRVVSATSKGVTLKVIQSGVDASVGDEIFIYRDSFTSGLYTLVQPSSK